MKFSQLMRVAVVAILTSGLSWSEPTQPTLSSQYVGTCSAVKNMATALEMWATDHYGQYPESLEELTPNYLRHIPAAGNGTAKDWVYLTDSQHRHYTIRPNRAFFGDLGVKGAFPRYDSDMGMLATPDGKAWPTSVKLPLIPNLTLGADWKVESAPTTVSYTNSRQNVTCYLQGITGTSRDAEDLRQFYLSRGCKVVSVDGHEGLELSFGEPDKSQGLHVLWFDSGFVYSAHYEANPGAFDSSVTDKLRQQLKIQSKD